MAQRLLLATPAECLRFWRTGPHRINGKKVLYPNIRQKEKKVKEHQLDGKILLYKQEPPLLKEFHIKEMAASQGMRVR